MPTSTVSLLRPPAALSERYRDFLVALGQESFAGEISTQRGERLVFGTDNSIYQRLPQAIVYPRDEGDVQILAKLAAQEAWRAIVLAPRGGGTGTNGQSLTDGIIVDLSRHMNRVLDIDLARREVRVQAGVVKDQLNALLAPHGLFFAPELSTSNRATLGGMISTDASGQGSCTYGKTRDHVAALEVILLGGERLHSAAVDEAQLERLCAGRGRVAEVHRAARRIQQEQAGAIAERFPPLNRCLTGYDLAHLREPDGRFNLNSVLCGSEGSLGFIVEATLRVLPIPKHSMLVNVRYPGFMNALRDARALMAFAPLSIETVDSAVLELAMRDAVWHDVAEFFPSANDAPPTRGINLVEFSGDDEAELHSRVSAFKVHLERGDGVARLGYTVAIGREAVERVYSMRKRAVGLLGNMQGEARPQPFVEDTAVPPEHLADYIAEFRQLLDGHGLSYGMFGHVDAGVLHVRPALDMKDAAQAALVRPISDAVARLTRKYGGLLWGEHGKGVRSEYAPAFFGDLYPALQELKAAFDPHNQLNPGKIATPSGHAAALLKIDEVPTRGQFDREIDPAVWRGHGAAMHCNGNGACYDWDPDDAMCPSWKATRERVHSPKGRATLMREWLRLQGEAGTDVLAAAREAPSFLASLPARWRGSRAKARGEPDFSHEVLDAMAGCLACKSCAGRCPVKVDVPDMRSKFLHLYHQRYLRPAGDYLIGSLEYTLPWAARAPDLYNALIASAPVRRWLERHAGIIDSPSLSRFDFGASLRRFQVQLATPDGLARLSAAQARRSVVLVQDAFTRFFESPLVADFIELASRLGFQVFLAPLLPNGKPLHVQGFLPAFERAAKKNAARLRALAAGGLPLVGLDPAMTLAYRQEYRRVVSPQDLPEVLLPQEWLAAAMPAMDGEAGATASYRLLAHCTEATNVPASVGLWQQVFAKAGLELQELAVGCCGMSGTYGHQTRNRRTSEAIFELSWSRALSRDAPHASATLLATGYSCRSQVRRLRGQAVHHPLQALLDHLRSAQASA